jgi:hypothetical protein
VQLHLLQLKQFIALVVTIANWHFPSRAKELLVVLVQALTPY